MQADPTNVRAATRAATCHIKMGQLAEATAVLEAVAATLPAGQLAPFDLVSKQTDVELTKKMITEVQHDRHTTMCSCCHILRVLAHTLPMFWRTGPDSLSSSCRQSIHHAWIVNACVKPMIHTFIHHSLCCV